MGKFSFIIHLSTCLLSLFFYFFFVQPPLTQVAGMLFKRGVACEQYKQLQKMYGFKNRVVLAMKSHYERVSAPESHSTSNEPGDHEDLSGLDQHLCLQLYVEYQEALDIQEAIKLDNLLDKENVHNASQFLAPNPQPLLCSAAITCHPLSAISNEAPALFNDEVSIKPPVGTKKQCLTSYDTNEVMVSSAASNQSSELAFQEMMKCKIWKPKKRKQPLRSVAS
jgi:hypothetical protein